MASISRELADRIKEWIDENYSRVVDYCRCEKPLVINNLQSPKADLGIIKKDGDAIAIEIEDGQTHPDTNVLKYWPLKVKFARRKHLTVIHIFGPKYQRDCQSRVDLAIFVAKRMKQDYPNTFEYTQKHFSGEKWHIEAEKFVKDELKKIMS